MFGWEFPPHNSGGLGVACRGLSKALADAGVSVVFVLPRPCDVRDSGLTFRFPLHDRIRERHVRSLLYPYVTVDEYGRVRQRVAGQYAWDLFSEVQAYALAAEEIALDESFDVIHAHDWLAFPAGLAAKRATGKPLILHVHLPSLDQGASFGADSRVYALEKESFEEADAIVVISHRVRELLEREYGVPPGKIVVIHNGFLAEDEGHMPLNFKKPGGAVALYMGRLTVHKGPDNFVRAAEIVVRHNPQFTFVIAGAGELETQLLFQVAQAGLGPYVLFAGFVRGPERRALVRYADMLVMPSVAEPFGLVALEAAVEGTPVILSKQSGVRDVLHNALAADFWDAELMAEYMLSLAASPPLQHTLSQEGEREARLSTWDKAAESCISLYTSCVSRP